MLSVILLSLVVCVVYAVRMRLKVRDVYKLPPPLPGELPFIGHTHILMNGSKDTWSFVKRISDYAVNNGGVIYMQILQDIYYVITDPEDATTVATTCLQKHFVYNFGKNWLGNGLITGAIDTNQRHRKILGPRSTAPVVHSFLTVFNENARKLVDEMNSASGKGAFDPTTMIKNAILETACLTTFGSNVKDNHFLQNYRIAVHNMLEIYTNRFTKAYLQSNLIYRLLGHQKREDILVNTLTKLTNKVIQDRKIVIKKSNVHDNKLDSINNNEIAHKPLLDYLLDMDGLLTDEEIKEELDTNIVASFDTISNTLVNMLVLVGSYPKVQERIYEELMQVLGPHRDIDKNDLQKLVYVKAVIKESIRLLPTGPIFARYIDREVKLKNYTMPARSQCVIIPYGIHRSRAWGPDADQFRPERWLDPDTVPENVNCFAGFSMGKRSCIGLVYAITLLTVVLAHLVRKSKWTADITRAKMQLYVTLKSTTGHEIDIERRTTDV